MEGVEERSIFEHNGEVSDQIRLIPSKSGDEDSHQGTGRCQHVQSLDGARDRDTTTSLVTLDALLALKVAML